MHLRLIAFSILLAAVSALFARQIRTGSSHTNRLSKESSPYLLQHSHNPVDWFPWGEEAFAKAKAEQKPVFLSVGYAACHWCHVMERESFESEEIARSLNEKFVCIKVDREERPDVDDLYMTAVQMMTGRGGWPMTVFLTPEGKPFYGGTYYPPDDFKKLIQQVAEVWKTRKPEVMSSSDRLAKAIQSNSTNSPRPSSLKPSELLKLALDSLRESYDKANGGFSKAPKFPPHNSLSLLLSPAIESLSANVVIGDLKSKIENRAMAFMTLRKMAAGGIQDHLGGGFHRYSTDATWLVPHFEKMLYDNALLVRAYHDAGRITGKEWYGSVANQTLTWAMREMRGPEGGFYSSLDADSEGIEGKYYLWKRSEILQILGPKAGITFCEFGSVEEGGNYREQASGEKNGYNILHSPGGIMRLGNDAALEPGATERWRNLMLAARSKRIRPATDDKRLAGWNGLMLGGLARCAAATPGGAVADNSLVKEAERTADFILEKMHVSGRLLRSWRPGSSNLKPGVLEDYAYVIEGLLELYAVTMKPLRLNQARELADEMIARFGDPAGGFFDTPSDGEKLLVRGKNPYDSALPSPNAVAVRDLYRLARATGDDRYLRIARNTVNALSGYAERNPAGCQTLILAAVELDDKKSETSQLPQTASAGPVTVSAQRVELNWGGGSELVISLAIKPGWHVNADQPLDKSLIGTRVRVETANGVIAANPIYPRGSRVRLGFSKEELAVYTGTVSVVVPVKVMKASASVLSIPIEVRFQACDDKACLAPVTLRVAASWRK